MITSNIHQVKGDATRPIGRGKKLIIHCCNDVGAWGAGFVLAISKRWQQPKEQFLLLNKPYLGTVQFVKCEPTIMVANIIGQRGVRQKNGDVPLRYKALKEGMVTVNKYAMEHNYSIHLPDMIGCNLAGGDRDVVLQMITEVFQTVPVYIYQFNV